MKLGEILVSKGLLKEEDVEKALGLQSLRGGRLGTNLVALRLIREDQLAQVLAEQMNCEAASWDEIENISHDVIDTLPMELADIHSAIPIRKQNSTITIGVSSPIEPVAKERLEKMIGYSLKEAVAPEVWIAAGLERYYNISREWRFSQSLDILAQDGCSLLLSDSLLKSLRTSEGIATGKRETRYLQNLYEAETPKHAVNEMLEYLWYHYPKQAVFSIEDNYVRGWIARGFPIHAVVFHDMTLPLKNAETLSQILKNEQSHHGSLSPEETESLLSGLRLQESHTHSLYPIIIEKRPLAVFIGWPSPHAPSEERLKATEWALEKLHLGLRILALRYHLFGSNLSSS